MIKKTFRALLVLIVLFFFFSPQKSYASFNFYISNISPSTVSSGGDEITVNLKITDLPSESYFRVSLQKTSGGSYFGFVQNNNGDWAKIQSLSGDCLSYYHVIDLTTSNLTLKFKVGDDTTIDDTSYKLKAHRFTKSCSYTEATNSADMTLYFPTPTPTPGPTSTPTPTPSPTKAPTPTKTPTPSPTKTPTEPKTQKSQSSSLSFSEPSPTSSSQNSKFSAVLGESTQKFPWLFILGIVFGVSAVALAIYELYQRKIGKNSENNI